MKHIIVGTAGHIDHGKTALVRALTGIDTDRLEEEKRRGITIDVGFAHLQLTPGLRLGFVDVPGHERFVKNMLAGAAGIDLVLFVIAADESIKPQTREHFDICRLLGIPKGVIVLTKADLVDRDLLELVRLEVEEFVAGSFLEGAPVVAASAVTGEGLDSLRHELARIAMDCAAKDESRHFRLPIDRSFAMKGFGAVVTGTLFSGRIQREAEVEIHPVGRKARVRGIQVHSQPADEAVAGQRTALNLADVDHSDLHRGMVLAIPGLLRSTKVFDARVDLLPSSPPLKHRAPVHFHYGTAETHAEIHLIGKPVIEPGSAGFARIRLRDAALLLPGDRFVLRRFSPVTTIGGGVVIDNFARPYRRKAEALARLERLAVASLAGRVATLVRESSYGLGLADLIARTGLHSEEIERIATEVQCVVLTSPDLWLVDRAWFESAVSNLEELVGGYHTANPLRPGVPRHDMKARLMPENPAFVWDAVLAASPRLALDGDLVRLKTHKVVLQEEEADAREAIERAFAEAGLAVPSLNEVLRKSGVEAAKARSLLQLLLRSRKLIRVGDDLVFHHTAIESLRELVSRHRGERFGVPDFKEWTNISRKYAIPLLEFCDREKWTRRDGDQRIVL